MNPVPLRLSRRQALKLGLGSLSGLVLGVRAESPENDDAGGARFSAFLTVHGDGTTTVTIPDAEVGQNVYTTLAKLVAEELDCVWTDVSIVLGGGNPAFANPRKGYQSTGHSMAVRGFFLPLRQLGASARQMLIEAAARRWGVPASSCRTIAGHVVSGQDERRAGYGSLAGAAAKFELPVQAPLKPRQDWQLIGRSTPRRDATAKANGSARYTIDIVRPGMLNAAIHQAPVLGSKIEDVDTREIETMPGIRGVVVQPDFVAVAADRYWQAKKALESLEIRWGSSPHDTVSTDSYDATLAEALAAPQPLTLPDSGLWPAGVEPTLSTDYRVPWLAHQTMEPMDCVASVEDGEITLWSPCQMPPYTAQQVSQALGVSADRIRIERPFIGGAFGRRFPADFSVQAALIAREFPGRPVKLIWSREEDTRHDYYRPAVAARLTASLGPEGRLRHLEARLATSSTVQFIQARNQGSGMDKGVFYGLADSGYRLPWAGMQWSPVETPVKIGPWRSVAYSHNVFFLESFLDECARHAIIDPLAYRLSLAGDRLAAVIETVGRMSGWGGHHEEGVGLGLAACYCFGSYIAQVAEVSLQARRPRVQRVWCAIDCGIAVDPDTIIAQMEGGIVFGLSAALHGRITMQHGRVIPGNFHEARVLTLAETPEITVSVIGSEEQAGGVGECAVPPIAPAVANAIVAAGGERQRSLPLITG